MLHLNLVYRNYHWCAWRLPENDPLEFFDPEYYVRLARMAEEAKLDGVFLADLSGILPGASRQQSDSTALDPLLLLSFVAARTSTIGVFCTVSTSWNDPFNTARKLATLDHLSRGRSGWNVVTSGLLPEAVNFGYDELPPHDDRYARAEEFIEVVLGLWDSWDDDALVCDREAGVVFDPERVRPISHRGERFSVQGPLTVPRPPQGRPLIMQAGSSDIGLAFAARYADVAFTIQAELESARRFREETKKRAESAGRDPDRVLVFPGVMPVVGRTREEAEARFHEIDDTVIPEASSLGTVFSMDIGELDLDAPLPEGIEERAAENSRSTAEHIVALARRESLTVGQLIRRFAWAAGHLRLVGTGAEIADTFQAWHEAGAADGFNLLFGSVEGDLDRFVEYVLPELRRRGLFREEYTGTTLREHYGLPQPD
jgi:FMN-dependent oxidoreductase (nitrilotriacetate monooxygenase family)